MFFRYHLSLAVLDAQALHLQPPRPGRLTRHRHLREPLRPRLGNRPVQRRAELERLHPDGLAGQHPHVVVDHRQRLLVLGHVNPDNRAKPVLPHQEDVPFIDLQPFRGKATTRRFSHYYDYPSAAWRQSCTRRTAAERANATIKDTATTSIARGWCRLTGLAPPTLWIACLLAARNQRILAAFQARQAGNARRAAAGLPPRTRKRRRTTLAQLATGP
jgi:hypothetical protein